MKLFIDTADTAEIFKWQKLICGVTTNPNSIKKSGLDIKDPTMWTVFANESIKHVCVQITSADEIQSNTRNRELLRTKIVYKVPLIYPEGYVVLKNVKNSGFMSCATMVYDLIQLNTACEMGVDFCMILLAKNDDENFLEDAVKLRNIYGYKTSLIVGSFRTKKDVKKAFLSGADYATVPPSVLELAFTNLQSRAEYSETYGAQK